MAADFIILPGEQKPVSKDVSAAALAQEWFARIKGISEETAMRLRKQVEHKLETGACRHLLPKLPLESLHGVELQRCIEQVVIEQWDSLTSEERLLTRFPTVQAVGAQVEIPKRGTGVVISRELTRRFGIEMVFRLQDGSLFKREFID